MNSNTETMELTVVEGMKTAKTGHCAAIQGGNENSGVFINKRQKVWDTYVNPQTNEILKTYILQAIEGKLEDKALKLLGTRVAAETWGDLKKMLKEHFGDKRDDGGIANEITQARPTKQETTIEFGERLKTLRVALLSKMKGSTPDGDVNMQTLKIQLMTRLY